MLFIRAKQLLSPDDNDRLITVASASGIAQWQEIQIGSEVMHVTNINGNNLTVTRGYNSTTKAAAAAGANVLLIDSADDALLESDDDFGFGELYSEFTDQKKRNPVSGNDDAI